MSLALLSILLGLGFVLPHFYGIVQPAAFAEVLRKFPRSMNWGYALMLAATAWFLWNVKQESISDFAPYKPLMLIGFAAVGIGSCFYVKDFLAVRGLAILLLLLAKVMLDTARWVDSEWRLVIVIWAYLWIWTGMWLTISPWRLRNVLLWFTADRVRMKIICLLRLVFGIFIVLLGILAF